MAYLISLLVALLCLSRSSFSRSWVGFGDKDISWETDSSEEEPGPNFKYYSEHGSWESDDDYNYSGYDHGHGYDLHSLNKQGYHNDREGHAFGCDHGHQHEFTHQHHGHNDYWESHGHNSQTGASGHPGKYGVPDHGQPDTPHGYHSGSYGHHGEHWGSHGHSSQTGSSSQRPSSGPPRELPQNSLIPPQRSSNDADRVVFPDFNNQVPTTRAPQPSRPSTTTVRPTTSTTTDRTLLNLVICIRACPVTSEYNPVCGTNNVTYNNPGALQCARNCGLNVAVARQASCPRFFPQVPQPTTLRPANNPTARAPITSQTTVRPPITSQTPVRTTVPTRFTNIDVNSANRPDATLIPLDILESVFGSASTHSNTEEPEFDIDKRINP